MLHSQRWGKFRKHRSESNRKQRTSVDGPGCCMWRCPFGLTANRLLQTDGHPQVTVLVCDHAFTARLNERHPLLTTEQPWVRVVTMVNATTNPFVGKPLTWRVQLSVLSLGLLVFISGVIGNVLIMMTLVSQKSLHSVHNIFIANLALADLVMSAYIMPFWLLDLVLGHHPVVNNVHCIVNAFFTHGAFNTALLTIVAISVHRYLCVCRNHLFVKVFTTKRTILCSFVLWILGFCECLPYLIMLKDDTTGYGPLAHICVFYKHEFGIYTCVIGAVMLFLPIPIIGVCNAAIFRVWKRSRARLGQWQQETKTPDRNRPSSRRDHDCNEGMYSPEEVGPSDSGNVRYLTVPLGPDHPDGNTGNEEDSGHPERLITADRQCLAPVADSINDSMLKESTTGDNLHTSPQHMISRHCVKDEVSSSLVTCPCAAKFKAVFEKITSQAQNTDNERTIATTRAVNPEALSSSDISLLRSLVIIFACCILTYLPMCVTLVIDVYYDLSSDVMQCVVFGLFFNHSINWIVYGVLNKNFAEGYKKSLKFLCRKHSDV